MGKAIPNDRLDTRTGENLRANNGCKPENRDFISAMTTGIFYHRHDKIRHISHSLNLAIQNSVVVRHLTPRLTGSSI
jgi:hypothetical protein